VRRPNWCTLPWSNGCTDTTCVPPITTALTFTPSDTRTRGSWRIFCSYRWRSTASACHTCRTRRLGTWSCPTSTWACCPFRQTPSSLTGCLRRRCSILCSWSLTASLSRKCGWQRAWGWACQYDRYTRYLRSFFTSRCSACCGKSSAARRRRCRSASSSTASWGRCIWSWWARPSP